MNYTYTHTPEYRLRMLFDKLIKDSLSYGIRIPNRNIGRHHLEKKSNWGYADSPGCRPGDAILALSEEDRKLLSNFSEKNTRHRIDYVKYLVTEADMSRHLWC